MKKTRIEKRIVPSAWLAVALFVLIVCCELFVMVGGLEIPTSVVARTMPFALDPFLRLTGEHPDSRVTLKHKSKTDKQDAESGESAMVSATGLSPEELSAAVEEPVLPLTNWVEVPAEAVVTNASPEAVEPRKPEKIIPVG